jgi:hypothetical protein
MEKMDIDNVSWTFENESFLRDESFLSIAEGGIKKQDINLDIESFKKIIKF